MHAEGIAIKVEYGSTSMTVYLSENPKIVNESGNLVLQTSFKSISLSLPCKVTPIGGTDTAIDNVFIRNNNENLPLNVYTLDGKKVATLSDKNEPLSLDKGIYIINGKKIIVK